MTTKIPTDFINKLIQIYSKETIKITENDEQVLIEINLQNSSEKQATEIGKVFSDYLKEHGEEAVSLYDENGCYKIALLFSADNLPQALSTEQINNLKKLNQPVSPECPEVPIETKKSSEITPKKPLNKTNFKEPITQFLAMMEKFIVRKIVTTKENNKITFSSLGCLIECTVSGGEVTLEMSGEEGAKNISIICQQLNKNGFLQEIVTEKNNHEKVIFTFTKESCLNNLNFCATLNNIKNTLEGNRKILREFMSGIPCDLSIENTTCEMHFIPKSIKDESNNTKDKPKAIKNGEAKVPKDKPKTTGSSFLNSLVGLFTQKPKQQTQIKIVECKNS